MWLLGGVFAWPRHGSCTAVPQAPVVSLAHSSGEYVSAYHPSRFLPCVCCCVFASTADGRWKQLLELSALCLRCEVGDLLEDESCWNIFLACYNLYHITTHDRAYGLLRDTAGNTLAHIVLMLFSRPRVSRASVIVPPASGGAEAAAGRAGNAAHEAPAASDAPAGNHGSDGVSGDAPGEKPAGFDSRTPSTRGTPGLWRRDMSPKREGGSRGGDGGVRSNNPRGFGAGGNEVQEEEPWPSVDGAGEDAASRGVGGGGVVAERGALAVMIGGGHGRRVDGGPVSPVRPRLDGSGADRGDAEGAMVRWGDGECGGSEEQGVLVKVVGFLSLLSDPRTNGSAECILSLSLINIALEAGGSDLGRIPALVTVMRGDLCKHLLQNSQTDDLDVLSLTLRVVFNLFNSIKDHLKVQLEVFLTR